MDYGERGAQCRASEGSGSRGRTLVRGLGNEAFLKLEVLLAMDGQQSGKICSFLYYDS